MSAESIDLKWAMGVIRSWLWLIVLCALLGGGLAYVVMSGVPPVYESTAILLVESPHDSNSSRYNDLIAGERLALTYSQLLTSQHVLAGVIDRLGLQESPTQLAGRVTAEPVANTLLIRVKAADATAERAAWVANTLAEELVAHVEELQTQRFRTSLSSLRAEMLAADAKVQEAQSSIGSLTARVKEDEAELARLAGLLAEDRTSLRGLRRDDEDLRLSLAEMAGKLGIVEAAQPPAIDPLAPYSATVTLLVNEEPLTGLGGSNATGDGRLAATYAQMVTQHSVLGAALADARVVERPSELAGRIAVSQLPGTQLIRLTVSDRDGVEAARLANAIAQALIDQVHESLTAPYGHRLSSLQTQIGALQESILQNQAQLDQITVDKIAAETDLVKWQTLSSDYRAGHQLVQREYEEVRQSSVAAANTVVITEVAQAPELPAQPAMLYISLAAVVSGLAATGAAFVIANIDPRLRTPEDVDRALGFDPIASIGRVSRSERSLVTDSRPHSSAAEAFCLLAANIGVAASEGSLKTLLVTSPMPGEGKSMVTANLAVALSRTGVGVAVVDADFKHPQQHKLFGLDISAGIVEALASGYDERNLRRTHVGRVKVLTGGEIANQQRDLVSLSNLRLLLADLAQTEDLVVIDSSSVLGSADTVLLASLADAVLMVVRAGQTHSADAQSALKMLRRARSRVLGVVLNAANHRPKTASHPYVRSTQEAGVHVDPVRDVSSAPA